MSLGEVAGGPLLLHLQSHSHSVLRGAPTPLREVQWRSMALSGGRTAHVWSAVGVQATSCRHASPCTAAVHSRKERGPILEGEEGARRPTRPGATHTLPCPKPIWPSLSSPPMYARPDSQLTSWLLALPCPAAPCRPMRTIKQLLQQLQPEAAQILLQGEEGDEGEGHPAAATTLLELGSC